MVMKNRVLLKNGSIFMKYDSTIATEAIFKENLKDVIGEQDDVEEEDVDEWMDINCNCCETCNNCCYFTKRIGCKNKHKQSRQSCKNTDLPIYIEKPPTSDLELPKYKFTLESLEIVNLSHILPDQSPISAKEEFQATLEDISNFQETLLKNDVEQEAHKETFREMLLLLRD